METKLFTRIIMLFVVIFSVATPVTSAFASSYPEHAPIFCSANPCTVLTTSEIKGLENDARPSGLYLKYGEFIWSTKANFTRVENPFGWISMGNTELVVSTIHILRNGRTSIPQMGLRWSNNVLVVSQPGWMTDAEVAVALPNPNSERTFPAVSLPKSPDRDNLIRTYSWDGARIYSWLIAPELHARELILHVLDLDVIFLTSVAQIPQDQRNVLHDNVEDFNWIPGERLSVEHTYTGSRKVAQENMLNTHFQAYWTWDDSMDIRREDGSLVNLYTWDIYLQTPCQPEERCYSKLGYPSSDIQTMYVDSYTLQSTTLLWTTSE